MAATTAASNVAYPIAGIMTAQIAGLPMSVIAIGIACYFAGIAARAGYELQRSAENGTGMKPSKIIGWVAGGIGTAPFATGLYLAVVKFWFHAPVDGPLLLGLMPVGCYGPGLLLWFMNFLITAVNKQFGTNIPPFASVAVPVPPKSGGV